MTPLSTRSLHSNWLRAFALIACIGFTGACTPLRAQGLTVGDARLHMDKRLARSAHARIYRQYTLGNQYLQFERSENGVFYGYRVCSVECPYQRIPFAALHDGNYLLVAYGRHDELYSTSDPQMSLLTSTTGDQDWDMVFSSLTRYTVEGRNLQAQSVMYGCGDGPGGFWHDRLPASDRSGVYCKEGEGAAVSGIWVATTDDVLAGTEASAVTLTNMPPASAPATPPLQFDPNDKSTEAILMGQPLSPEGKAKLRIAYMEVMLGWEKSYAAGEVTAEEYEKHRKDLEQKIEALK